MQSRTERRTVLISSLFAVLAAVWMVVRIVGSGAGVPAWLFWPFLGLEAFALVRLVTWGFRIAPPASPSTTPATVSTPEPLGLEVAVLVVDDDVERLRSAVLSATRVRGAVGIVVVGPESEHTDELAGQFGARRVTADGDQCALAHAAVAGARGDIVAFVTSDSVAHHDLASLVEQPFADETVGWVQSMSRSAPERDAAMITMNDVTGPADGDAGIAAWAVNASAIRVEALRSDGDPTVSTARRSPTTTWMALSVDGWQGRWSRVALAIENGPESELNTSQILASSSRLRSIPNWFGPKRSGSLGARGRTAAWSATLDDLTGSAALVLLLVLSASLVVGRVPFDLDAWGLVVAGVAVHAVAAMVRWHLSDRRLGAFESARAAFASIDTSVSSVSSALLGRVVGRRSDRVSVAFVATTALLIALGARALSSITGWPLGTERRLDEMAVLTSAVIATLPLLRAIDVIIPTRRRRGSSRAGTDVGVEINGSRADIVDLGPLGIGVRSHQTLEPGTSVHTRLDIPGRPEPLSVAGIVRSSVEFEDDSYRLGIEFVDVSGRRRDELMEFWAASWVPSAAASTSEAPVPRVASDLKVRVNRRSSPALRVLAAVTLVATGVASLPPYGVASAAEPPLPENTFAVVKDMRGVAPSGSDTQGSVLVGAETAVTLTGHNTWSADNDKSERYFNVGFTDVVPAGVRPVPGSFDIEPTRTVSDTPTDGATTLVWTNVSDALPGSTTSIRYRLEPDPDAATQLAVGDSIAGRADAFASTDPRRVPSFDRSGVPTSNTADLRSSTVTGSVTIVPLQVAKSEPSPEGELVRGAGLPTTYALRVDNNAVAATGSVTVDDHLPAELEFLGCGTVDHTAGDAGETKGAERLDVSTPDLDPKSGCITPVSVETMEVDPDDGGPLLKGLYTHVRWNLGDLGPGESVTIRYAAAIPERANVAWPDDSTPDPRCGDVPDSCGQLANLDNNTGDFTSEGVEETRLTNLATVAGTYTGPLADGVERTQVWGRATHSVTAEDLALDKTACNVAANGTDSGDCTNGVEYGGQTDWDLRIRTGAYREVSDLLIADQLPDGLAYVEGSASIVDGSDVTPAEPSVSTGAGADGSSTQQLDWKLSNLEPGSERRITFRTVTLSDYRGTGLPVLTFDTLRNVASVTGVSAVVNGTDPLGERTIGDRSSDELSSSWSSVTKRTLTGEDASSVSIAGERCSAGWTDAVVADASSDDGPARFAVGDLVCFDLLVDLPAGLRVRNAAIADFLPLGTEYVGTSVAGDNTAGQFGEPELDRGYANAVLWEYGTPLGSTGDRFTPAEGARFHVVLGARIAADTESTPSDEPFQNLLKVSGVDTSGSSRVSPRDVDEYLVAKPVIGLTKGVTDIRRGDASLEGYPLAGPTAGDDRHAVGATDRVSYRIDVANTGVQFRNPGENPYDPRDDTAATTDRGQRSRLRDADMAQESADPSTSNSDRQSKLSQANSASPSDDERSQTEPSFFGSETDRRQDGLDQLEDVERGTRSRLSTGRRINSAQDDAAGRLSTGMRVNGAGAQVADATDVRVIDVLPAGLDCATLTDATRGGEVPQLTTKLVTLDDALPLAVAPPVTIGELTCDRASRTVSFVIDRVPAGHRVEVTYEATVPDGAGAGATHRNIAGVRSYTDLSGTATYLPEDNIDTSIGPDQYERPNAPAAVDSATVQLPAASVTKSATTSISEPKNNATGQATIGERISYSVAVEVPAGTSVFELELSDPLPKGLTLVSGSTKVSGPDDGAAPKIELTEADSGSGLTAAWPGEYRNASSAAETFIVTYDAVVDDISSNKHGAKRTNTATITWNDTPKYGGPSGSPAAMSAAAASTVSIVEPAPSIVKLHSPDGAVNGGASVDYTVDVSNASGRPPLHDVAVFDCVPDGLGEVTPTGPFAEFAQVSEPTAPCAEGSTRIDWELPTSLQPGAKSLLTYSATVMAPAAGDAELVNTASVAGSSLSAAGGDEGRDSYSATATDTVRIASPTIVKSADTTLIAPGGSATYTLDVTIPSGVLLNDATIVDVLPADSVFVAYGDLPDLTAAGESGGTCLTSTAPHTIERDGTHLGWFLGDIFAEGGDCSLRLTYTTYVGSAAEAGDVLSNNVDLLWNLVDRTDDVTEPSTDGFDVTLSATAGIDVGEPSVTAAKTVNDGDAVVDAGQRLGYTVTVTNAGAVPAFDLTVDDTYPAGLGTPSEFGGTCPGAADATADGENRTVRWAALFAGAEGLGTGQSCILTYVQAVDPATADTLEDGATLENTVVVSEYFAAADHDAGDRDDPGFKTYSSDPVDETVTVVLPKLSIDKATASGDEVADADIGSPAGWQLVISNEGRGTAYGVDVTDTLPANWTFDEGSVGIVSSDGSGCEPAAAQSTPTISPVDTSADGGEPAQRIDWSDLCDLGPRSTVTITFTATPTADAARFPGLVDDSGDKALHPNVATVAGSDAGGSPLAGASDDAAASLRSADLRVRITDSSADGDGAPDSAGFIVGQPGEYYVDVANRGPDPATGPIEVTSNIPAGLTATAATGEGWECTIGDLGVTVTCTAAGPLAADASLTRIVITVDVGVESLNTDDSSGTVTATASVRSASPDPAESDNSDDEPTPVRRVSDLSVAKTLDASTPFVAGTDVRYLVTVTNEGASPASGPVTVVDDLPDGLRLVSVSGEGWDCSASTIPSGAAIGSVSFSGTAPNDRNGQVSCERDGAARPAGSSFEPVAIVTSVDPAVRPSTRVTNVATVEHANDAEPSNDSSDSSSDSTASATLSVVKDDGGATFTAGQNDARYYITVANTGPSVEAGPVTVRDAIGTHLQLATLDAPGWSCSTEPGTGFGDGERGSLDCTWSEAIGVGESLPMITVGVRVDPAAITDPRPSAENLVTNRAAVVGGTDTKERSDTVETPVVPSASLTVDKTHDTGTDPWTVGSTQKFGLQVSNDGPSAEYGRVVLTDILPEGFRYVGATGDGWSCELRTGAGTGPNGTVRCVAERGDLAEDAPLLAAGGTLPPVTVEIEVLPEAAPVPQADPKIITNRVTNTAAVEGVTDSTPHTDSDTVPIRPLADLVVSKTHDAESFQVGETGEFDITVTNDGPNVAAAPIVVTDTLPTGLTYSSASGADWDCTPDDAGSVVTCAYGRTLGSDESATVQLVVDVGPSAYDAESHTVRNTVSVSGPSPDPDDGNDAADDTVTITPLVDLAIEKRHDGDFSVGAVGEFELDVSNVGPNALPSGPVTVTDTLPDGLTFVSAAGSGWTCEPDDAGVVITCTNESGLAVGEHLSTIYVAVDVESAAEGGVVNRAEVAADVVDADATNDSDDDEVTIVPLSNLSLTKSVQGQLTVGQEAVWRLVVTNDGPSAAVDPVVVDRMPDHVSEVTASGDGFACAIDDRTVTCQRTSPLPAGASAELLVTALITGGGGDSVTNRAAVSTSTPERSDDDNSASVSSEIVEVAGNGVLGSASANGGSASSGGSLPSSLAFTGLTVLGILAAAASLLLGGFILTGFGRRRRGEA